MKVKNINMENNNDNEDQETANDEIYDVPDQN